LKLRLVITGSGAYLAQDLIARLGSDPNCEFILGLDLHPSSVAVNCPAEFLQFDLTRPWEEMAELFRTRAVNTGLHLAWQFNPIHDRERQHQVDVEGSRNFFRSAEAVGLKRIVYTGSTTVYVNPASPTDPPFLTEETELSGTPRYLYSKHKVEVDRMAQEFIARHPEMQVVILRAPIVLGQHTQNIVSKMIEWPWRSFPWMFQVRGADPPMQFISEEDIAAILYRALTSEAAGVFNAAGDGVLRFSEFVRAAGKKSLAIPAPLLYSVTALAWALRLSPFPPGIFDLIRYPWVADTTRLKTVFGYTPRHTSRQAVEAFLAVRRT